MDATQLCALDANALESFIFNIYAAREMPVAESKAAIQASVARISHPCAFAHGLMITRNGYFVTAKHCIDHSPAKEFSIVLDRGTYPVERVCMVSANQDMALAKAAVNGEAEAIRYRLYSDQTPETRLPIVALSYAHGPGQTLRHKGGFVLRLNSQGSPVAASHMQNHLLLDMSISRGQSGSPVVDIDGSLIGLVSSGVFLTNSQTSDMASCCRTYNILQLVSMYAQHLKN